MRWTVRRWAGEREREKESSSRRGSDEKRRTREYSSRVGGSFMSRWSGEREGGNGLAIFQLLSLKCESNIHNDQEESEGETAKLTTRTRITISNLARLILLLFFFFFPSTDPRRPLTHTCPHIRDAYDRRRTVSIWTRRAAGRFGLLTRAVTVVVVVDEVGGGGQRRVR